MEQYGFDPIYEEDEKKEESNIVVRIIYVDSKIEN